MTVLLIPPELEAELVKLSSVFRRWVDADNRASQPARYTAPGAWDSLNFEADEAEQALRAQVLAVLRVFGGVET